MFALAAAAPAAQAATEVMQLAEVCFQDLASALAVHDGT